jgi:KDO2-lipid IV(A) lauroyltransferase
MYYLLLAIAYPLSILPLRVLYLLSDVVYILIYYVLRYRKKIAFINIQQSFPEKSTAAHKTITKQFFKSFCDHWFEVIKMLTISSKEIKKRYTGNWELLATLHAQNKNAYILLGHRFNWEWIGAAWNLNTQQQFAGMYLPVSNKAFDKLILKIRQRKGAIYIPANNMRPYLKMLTQTTHVLATVSDQSPGNLRDAYWYNFLHRPAPFISGSEKIPKLTKAVVIYAHITKLRRGYYHVNMEEIASSTQEMATGDITKIYIQKLQQDLQNQPYNWLWTHRRWKHQPGAQTIIQEL